MIAVDDDLRRLAATLKALPIEQDPDPEPGGNLLSYTFRQKLVTPDVQGAHLSIAHADYLKGLAVVDYFVHVLAGETRVLDNLRYIVEQARARNPRPMLTLPLILVECGLRLRELPEDLPRSPDVRRRYDAHDAAPDPATLARPADPYYLALAALLAEQVDAGRRPSLTQAPTRQAIKAVLFTDAVLQLGPAPETALEGDPFAAAVAAAQALRTLSTPQLLQRAPRARPHSPEVTPVSQPHTLELLARQVPDEERLHAALLLAYVNSLYRVLASFSVPAPLYRLLYDEASHHLQALETQGSARVPHPQALDISALDVVVISNLRDIPVLFEGETGVGKTYVSQSFLRTLFPRDSCLSLRLSGNTFLNNVFQPFLEGHIENGMPVTRIKMQAVESIAGLFVDEINRGDPQNVLQLLDNELYNAGQFVRLGVRIPHLQAGQVTPGRRRKKLAILTAQNPPASVDARFSSTLELDAAVDNRLLKVEFGNAAGSAGTTLWLEEEPADPHQEFLDCFANLSAGYLGVDGTAFAGLPENWLSLYAWIADPWWTDKPTLYSGLELADLMVCVLGGDLARTYERERTVCSDWEARLRLGIPAGIDLPETERSKKIQQAVATFRVPVIYRDIVQIKKLADVLATLWTIKDASRTADPVQAYLQTRRLVTVREVAGAAALLARNKQVTGSASAVPVINEVLVQYVALVTIAQKVTKYARDEFHGDDENTGAKKLVLAKALRETLAGGRGARALCRNMAELLNRLGEAFSATEDVRNLLLMRTLADLATLCGFLLEHEAEADTALTGARGIPEAIERLAGIYQRVRAATALTLPDIYQHRVQRTLGV